MPTTLHKLVSVLVEQVLNEAKVDRYIRDNPEFSIFLSKFKDLGPKYLDWLLGQAKKLEFIDSLFQKSEQVAGMLNEELDKYYEVLQKFDTLSKLGYIEQKDIGKYTDFKHLASAVADSESRQKAKEEERETLRATKSQKDVVYEDDTYLVMEPKSEGASCHYGKGTKWCISAIEAKNYFHDYVNRGYRFIFVINKKTNDKDAVAFNPETVQEYGQGGIEIYDTADAKMEFEEFNTKYPAKVVDLVTGYMGYNSGDFTYHFMIPDLVNVYTNANDKVFIHLSWPRTEFFSFEHSEKGVEVYGRSAGDEEAVSIPAAGLRDSLKSALNGVDGKFEEIEALLLKLVGTDVLSLDNIYVKALDSGIFSSNNFFDALNDVEEDDLNKIVAAVKNRYIEFSKLADKLYTTDFTNENSVIYYMQNIDRYKDISYNVMQAIQTARRYEDEEHKEIGAAAEWLARYLLKLHEENYRRFDSQEFVKSVKDSGYLETSHYAEQPKSMFGLIKKLLIRSGLEKSSQ